MANHSPPPMDWNHLIHEAFDWLQDLAPILATALYRHTVEGYTVEEVARAFKVDVRTVQRWLQGHLRHDHVYIMGAEELLREILELFEEACQCHRFETLSQAFRFASGANPWKTSCLVTLFLSLQESKKAGELEGLLAHLDTVSDTQAYAQTIFALLERYAREHLEGF
jgi:Homeodomain-like domain-containing protein